MRIHVRYFAVFRERLRRDAEELDLPTGATVAQAIDALAARHAPVEALRGRFQVARNQEMSSGEDVLGDGDELALIPPVAGGERHARMVADRPSLDRVVAAVSGPDMGGVVTFTGTVRRENRGRSVVRLEYEAFGDMAERVMARLCEQIERELPGCRVAVEHASGALAVGEIAVVIAAAAPHRAEAFDACRRLIDRLKESVPIWKKEIGPDGDEWIGLGP
jgi:molybdopterin synthase catalytic subunit